MCEFLCRKVNIFVKESLCERDKNKDRQEELFTFENINTVFKIISFLLEYAIPTYLTYFFFLRYLDES
jgi:hypothetical protein